MALDKLTKLTSNSGISTVIDYTMSDLVVDSINIAGGGTTLGKDFETRNLKVTGLSTFVGNVQMDGNLTVNGTTTTLDTVLTEVDQLLVAANNTTVGAAITQSGSGGILRLFDSATQVFSVEDGGHVTASGSITANSTLTVAQDVTIKNAKSLYLANDAENKSSRIYNSAGSGAANLTFMTVQSGGSEATALSLDPNLNATFGSSLTIPDYIIHDGDTNTKFGFSGADTFSVETAGSERLSINSSGELISTNGTLRRNVSDSSFTVSGDSASNAGANINLYGASHASLANVFRVRVATSEKFRINSSGDVCIGGAVSDIGNKLNVVESSGNAGIILAASTVSASGFADFTFAGACCC